MSEKIKVHQMKIEDGDLTGESVSIHLIQMPTYYEKDWYRQGISYSAFFESLKERNKSEKYLYHRFRREPWEAETELGKMIAERDAELPKIEHESLYEFFDYINYDRKRKKIIDI